MAVLGALAAAVAGLLLVLVLVPAATAQLVPFLWDDLVAFATMVRSSLRCHRRLSRRPAVTPARRVPAARPAPAPPAPAALPG